MRNYLIVEFVAQDDDVFKVGREHFLGGFTVVPNLGLAEEIEPGPLDDARMLWVGLRAEEYGRSEDSFKGCYQSPIFLRKFAFCQHEIC